jgi:hypothetical protein
MMTPEPQPRAFLSHPGRVAVLIGIASQALFSYRLTTPHKIMFDEVHYVSAGRQGVHRRRYRVVRG